jgi:glycerol-3-phosphate acyltransferase PlsY
MVIISFILAYLIGSVSFSYLITKKIKKVDIRQLGSGNAGATNTMRVLGTGPAIAVLLLDVLKGVAAVLIAMLLHLPHWAAATTGLCAIIGHNFPVYFNFRGGKGVATTIGVFMMLMIFPSLYAGIVAIIVIAVTRFVSLGSLLFIILTPLFAFYINHYPESYSYIGFIIALLAIYQHRTNISRLKKGEENKIGKKKTAG